MTVGRYLGLLAVVLVCLPTWGQQSASFSIEQAVFNAGGRPADGLEPASVSFSISLDSIAGGLDRGTVDSGSFQLQAGWLFLYAPPGEVTGLRFDDGQTLAWNPEPTVGSYSLLRGALASLADAPSCLQSDLGEPSAIDVDLPAPGSGVFYLATASNRLGEPGTPGFRSDGTERARGVCP